MKTIEQYLHELPEPAKYNALHNADSFNLDHEVEDIQDALLGAFSWEHSVEGKEYWVEVYNSLKGT